MLLVFNFTPFVRSEVKSYSGIAIAFMYICKDSTIKSFFFLRKYYFVIVLKNLIYIYLYCFSLQEEEVIVRKKRPGLSQGIVPSKKAMMFHNKVYNKQ